MGKKKNGNGDFEIVNTEHILAVGYYFEPVCELQIQFQDGNVFAYDAVPSYKYFNVLKDPDNYYEEEIKNKYTFKQLNKKED